MELASRIEGSCSSTSESCRYINRQAGQLSNAEHAPNTGRRSRRSVTSRTISHHRGQRRSSSLHIHRSKAGISGAGITGELLRTIRSKPRQIVATARRAKIRETAGLIRLDEGIRRVLRDTQNGKGAETAEAARRVEDCFTDR